MRKHETAGRERVSQIMKRKKKIMKEKKKKKMKLFICKEVQPAGYRK